MSMKPQKNRAAIPINLPAVSRRDLSYEVQSLRKELFPKNLNLNLFRARPVRLKRPRPSRFVSWFHYGYGRWGRAGGLKNVAEAKFSEGCLPGVDILPTPRGSILHTTRGSQLPYNTKKTCYLFLICFLYFPYSPYLTL